MLERIRPERKLTRFTTALCAASLLVGACSSADIVNRIDGMALPHCFEKPTPPAKTDANGNVLSETQAPGPVLRLKKKNGVVPQDPGKVSAKVQQKIAGAVVKVTNGTDREGIMGSGFLTTMTIKGQPVKVAITAAHVVRTDTLTTLTVLDNFGHKTGVTGGCYTADEGGKFKRLPPRGKEGTPPNLDLAVLKLADPSAIGKTTLKLASKLPERGSWEAALTNYQGDSSTQLTYNALSLGLLSEHRFMLLDGIQSNRNCEPDTATKISVCASQGGSSGGPIYNRINGDVFGISNAMMAPTDTMNNGGQAGSYLSRTALESFGRVETTIPLGPGTGNWPSLVIGMDSNAVGATLNQSPVLQNAG
jgi:hypothetical protein